MQTEYTAVMANRKSDRAFAESKKKNDKEMKKNGIKKTLEKKCKRRLLLPSIRGKRG
jgi:hypothetical protein